MPSALLRRYVIDTGRMKQNEYDAATSMQQLVEARPSNLRPGLFLATAGLFLAAAGLFLAAAGLFLATAGLFLAAAGLFLAAADGSACLFVCLLLPAGLDAEGQRAATARPRRPRAGIHLGVLRVLTRCAGGRVLPPAVLRVLT